MEFNITARHFDLTDTLHEHIMDKFSKIKKYFRGTAKADITLSVEKHRQIVEVSLHGNRTNFIAKEESSDMYTSIDLVVDSLEMQIKRDKEKKTDRRSKAPKIPAKKATTAISYGVVEKKSDQKGVKGHQIIQSKKFAIKPMSVDEAALQLDTLPDDFLVFRNAATNRVNVMYKRKDNNFGLIEPE